MYPLLDAENKGLAQKWLFVKLRPLRSLTAIVPALLLSVPTSGEEPRPPAQETHVDVHAFRVVESYSGPVSYYKIVEDPVEPFHFVVRGHDRGWVQDLWINQAQP